MGKIYTVGSAFGGITPRTQAAKANTDKNENLGLGWQSEDRMGCQQTVHLIWS